MSRKGNCWDDAVGDSFFRSLKTELIYGNKLISKEQMKLEIFEYIEIWYNRKRRHSALNYATIEEFNNQPFLLFDTGSQIGVNILNWGHVRLF